MKLVLLWVSVLFIAASVSLNHGRDAKPGEFPYVVRILVSEEEEDGQHDHDHGHDHEHEEDAATVATGVLISSKRILTTCDSVGFFTGQKVNLYSLSRVIIMGGSVSRDGKGGQIRKPNFSSTHPYCYSLLVSKVVLFNYGIYTIPDPFGSKLASPIKNVVETKREMEVTLRKMWEGRTSIKCVTAAWGNPRKQFEGNGMPDLFERFSKVLQTTQMEIVNYPVCYRSTCINFRECLISIWEYGFVCAKASRGGPCNEDSGAPLVCSGQLYGIHANPQTCEDDGLPRHFLRIDLAYGYVFDVEDGSAARKANELFLTAAFLLTSWRQLMT